MTVQDEIRGQLGGEWMKFAFPNFKEVSNSELFSTISPSCPIANSAQKALDKGGIC